MFNIGFAELILILLVAFVFVGPKDLPKVAAALGRGVRYIKQLLNEFKEDTGLNEVVDEFKKTSRDLEKTVRENDPAAELKKAGKEIEEAVRSAEKAAQEAMKQ